LDEKGWIRKIKRKEEMEKSTTVLDTTTASFLLDARFAI
jgi:chromosome segregation and condensation protein ScpB